MKTYSTLCFKTQKQAVKNQAEINLHFSGNLISSEVLKGIDERNNKGFYVKYTLSK